MDTFCIGDIEAKPGTKASGFLPVKGLSTPDGTGNFWNIPVIIVNGTQDGPVFEVDACMHGNETEGAYIVYEILKRINPKKLKGTLIAIPVLNGPGFLSFDGLRGTVYDKMHTDMNRVFPGIPKSYSITSRATYTFWNEIVKKCDYTVNLHGATKRQMPRVAWNEAMPDTLEMCKAIAYTPEYIITSKSEHTKLKEATMSNVCSDEGILNVWIESGTDDHSYAGWREDVNIIATGVENCMRKYGMLEGKVIVPEYWRHTEYYTHVRGEHSGICYTEPALKINNMVKKGQVLMRIVDFLGNEIEQLCAPHDGIVINEHSDIMVGYNSHGFIIGRTPTKTYPT